MASARGIGIPSNDQNDPDSARTFEFARIADYNQLYLENCQLASELDQQEGVDPDAHVARIDAYVAATVLSPDAYVCQLGVAHGTLCILTARNFTAPLTVQLRADAPANDFTPWDRVVEAQFDVPSGCNSAFRSMRRHGRRSRRILHALQAQPGVRVCVAPDASWAPGAVAHQ